MSRRGTLDYMPLPKLPHNGQRGSQKSMSKLQEKDVPVIRQLRRDKMTQKAIAEIFGVSTTTIQKLLDGTTWSHVKG